MAKNINTFNIPGYQTYQNEADYVSPTNVSKETIQRIKKRHIGVSVLDAFSLQSQLDQPNINTKNKREELTTK